MTDKRLPPWVRIDTGFFSDPKIVHVGLHGWIVYLALIVINGRERSGGKLDRAAVSTRTLANLTGLTVQLESRHDAESIVEGALKDCVEVGLLSMSANEIEILGWEKWEPPLSSAERMRRYRKSDAQVTPSDAQVTECDDDGVTVTPLDQDQDQDQDHTLTGERKPTAAEKRGELLTALTDRLWARWMSLRAERDKSGEGMSEATRKAWRGLAKNRLQDGGVKLEAIKARASAIEAALILPLVDDWMIRCGHGLSYIFKSATVMDKQIRAAEGRAWVESRQTGATIADRYGQTPARIRQLVLPGKP